ncbi:hypothetical protein MAGCAS_169 [Candidatus Hodgkinia cicadicola]|uniref:Uncharacterized protein n=1 Tax=Candidatus Hodgkinia cicadicola TaxID=573658 RepID=A0ABX4MET1_9HYPH|nr:hypothetical protein MAGCAS_169 [Candidatus Hodgkinia cicadicola]PIM96713.1 hypothetical protein magtcs_159 [Candidatus Hodgkinia cicadicola]
MDLFYNKKTRKNIWTWCPCFSCDRCTPIDRTWGDGRILMFSSNILQFYIGIVCLSNIVINKSVIRTNIFTDCCSNVVIRADGNDFDANFVVNSNSKVIVKLFIRKTINVKLVIGSNSKIRLIIDNTLISSKLIQVTSILSDNTNIIMFSNSIVNRCSIRQTICESIIGNNSTAKIILNVLMLGKSHVIVKPVFRIKNPNSTCIHSINVNNMSSNVDADSNNRNTVNLLVLKTYSRCII